MEKFLKYIGLMICALSVFSCSLEEAGPDGTNSGTTIEFIARPTSFTTCDVATKAEKDDIESAIHTAYLFVFDSNGNSLLEDKDSDGNTICYVSLGSSLSYKYNMEGDFTACILANVPLSYVSTIESLSDLSAPLDLEYSSGTEYIGMPYMDLDGDDIAETQCLPMFGTATSSAKKDNKILIELESLFSKVNLTVKLNWMEGAEFDWTGCVLNNLPSEILPIDTGTDSECENFADPDLSISDLGSIANEGEEIRTFYVPEYFLTPDSDKVRTYKDESDKEMYKPLLYDIETQFPIFFTVTGEFTHISNDNGFTYNVFLGKNTFDSFDIERNHEYNFTMTIEGINKARLELDNRVYAEIIPIDLASIEPSNCYIISKPGRYRFPACMGKNSSRLLIISDNDLNIIDYGNDNVISNLKVIVPDTDATDQTYYVEFDVNMEDYSAVTNGNVLLNFGTWSWHLWFCEDTNRPDDNSILDTYPNTNYRVMNRALGATSYSGLTILNTDLGHWSDGFYYQWGRKDPMVLNTYTISDVSSINNPTVYYTGWTGSNGEAGWSGDNKMLNDPCPPGYTVPSAGTWVEVNSSDGLENVVEMFGQVYPYNLALSTNLSRNIVYPYSGYISAVTGETAEGVQFNEGDLVQKDTVRKPYYSKGPVSLGLEVLKWSIYSDRIKNIRLYINMNSLTGRLWVSDEKTSYKYDYAGLDFSSLDFSNLDNVRDFVDIIGCDVQHNDYEITYRTIFGQKIPTGVKDHWQKDSNGNDLYKKYPGDAVLTDNDKLALLMKLLEGGQFFESQGLIDNSVNPADAAHVRCVKE